MIPSTTETGNHRIPRGVLILVGLAVFTISIAGIKACSNIIGPFFLAIALVITVYPVRHWFDRHGWPRWIGSTIIVLCVYLILVLLMFGLVMSIGRMATLLPMYAPQINALIAQAGALLNHLGVQTSQVHALTHSLNAGRILSFAKGILSGTFGVVSNLVLIAILVLFIGFDSSPFPGHLWSARREHSAIVQALFSFAHATRRYFAVTAIFGFAVAVIDTAALMAIGIPDAIVWGVLAFVTNFVPNVGFVIGVIPPAVIGLLEGGVSTMILVIVVYAVINTVIQTIIQPKVIGNAMGISSTITFLSLLFWSFVLGPLGAILAIPLTLLAKAVLVDAGPEAKWLEPLLSGKSAKAKPPPPSDDEA